MTLKNVPLLRFVFFRIALASLCAVVWFSNGFAQGGPGCALSFDGSDDQVVIPGFGTNVPTTEVTVEFWQRVFATKYQSTFSASAFINGSVFNAHVPYIDGNVYWDFGNIST